MNSMIYNPMEEYEKKLKDQHLEHTKNHLEELIKESGINEEENRKTVKEYTDLKENLKKIKRKFNLWRVLRVVMIITLLLIPLVILKITPKIKALRKDIQSASQKLEELLSLAQSQMAPLNRLFTDRDALNIIEKTIPMLSFAPGLSAEQEANMIINYDFNDHNDLQRSTVDLLAGQYNENPFLFERKLIHRMGVEVYHGYKVISWEERYRDSDGEWQTRTRTQTLHASVTKPKPFYSTEVMLNYCAQGGPELSFTRDATNLDKKDDKEIEKYVKKGAKKLKKKTDKAIKKNEDFVSMSNEEFEVLFDALDRTNEVQFRTLFTPLAQTNMVDLIRSSVGYGDDFNFIKQNRTNKIMSRHSQGRGLNLSSGEYVSYSIDLLRENFLRKNEEFFKAVYFDFAPLWAIPVYQERPVHSLEPIPDTARKYSYKECETLSNLVGKEHLVHPLTKTQAIMKSAFVGSGEGVDEIRVSAYSYDMVPRLDFIPVHGGDGRWHNVPVPWDEYIPLESTNNLFVATEDLAKDRDVLAQRNDICIFR